MTFPLFDIAVATITPIRDGIVAGGVLFPGLLVQQPCVSVFVVAVGSHGANVETVSANPLKLELASKFPAFTWSDHEFPQKFTLWPTWTPPGFPPQITKPVGRYSPTLIAARLDRNSVSPSGLLHDAIAAAMHRRCKTRGIGRMAFFSLH